MEKKPYSLRTNIGYFLNKPIGFSRNFEIAYDEVFIEPDLNVRQFKSAFTFSRTHEGLLLEAQLQGKIAAICGRCLSPFYTLVKTSFEELYFFSQRSQDDADLVIPENGYIDLGVIFREYLLLELPINPLCSSDCKGLCPNCGQNLNEKLCEHELARQKTP